MCCHTSNKIVLKSEIYVVFLFMCMFMFWNIFEFGFWYSCQIFLDSIGSVWISDWSGFHCENTCHGLYNRSNGHIFWHVFYQRNLSFQLFVCCWFFSPWVHKIFHYPFFILIVYGQSFQSFMCFRPYLGIYTTLDTLTLASKKFQTFEFFR